MPIMSSFKACDLMMPFLQTISRLALVLLWGCGGLAVSPAFASSSADSYFYISPHDLPPDLLQKPPSQESAAEHQQIIAVIKAQQHLSDETLRDIRNEQHMRLDIMTDILGHRLTREKNPQTFQFLEHVLANTESLTENDKQFWHTKRPYLLDPKVKLLVDPLKNSPSYPSGHTSGSWVLAEVLGILYPDAREALRAQASAVGQHRIAAGVHTPFDVEGGHLLAMQILGALLENEDFQLDLLAAQEEINKAATITY